MAIPPFGAPPFPGFATDTLHVLRAGDTMTGDLTVTPAANDLTTLKVNRAGGAVDVLTVDTTDAQTTFRGINDLATLGTEQLASPGNFNLPADWTLPGPEWVGSATTLTGTLASSTVLATVANFPAAVIGTVYRINFRSTSVTAGSFTLNLGGVASNPISTNSGFAGSSVILTAVSTAGLSIVGTGFSGAIAALSVKVVTQANAVVRFKGSAATLLGEIRDGGTANYGAGLGALASNLSGSNDLAVGVRALASAQAQSNCVALGANALAALAAGLGQCLAVGANAGQSLYAGTTDVFIGYNAGSALQVGNGNTVVGGNSYNNAVSGTNNLILGGAIGTGLTTGSTNILIGFGCGNNITTGSGNIMIGQVNAPSAGTSNYLSIADVLKGDTSLKIIGANVTPAGNGYLQTQAGTSGTPAKVGGTLFDHFADAGNSTTVETDLYSDTIAASTLANNGDKLQAQYGGTFVSSGTATREVRLYFGGTAIFDTGALSISLAASWVLDVLIMRVDAATVRYKMDLTVEGAALAAYTAAGQLAGLTLSSTNVLKITGQAAGVGAATNDIVAKVSTVEWKSAA
jgi:hypothetical protein